MHICSCTTHSGIFKFNSWGKNEKRQDKKGLKFGLLFLNWIPRLHKIACQGKGTLGREAEASQLQGRLCMCCCWPCPGKWIDAYELVELELTGLREICCSGSRHSNSFPSQQQPWLVFPHRPYLYLCMHPLMLLQIYPSILPSSLDGFSGSKAEGTGRTVGEKKSPNPIVAHSWLDLMGVKR